MAHQALIKKTAKKCDSGRDGEGAKPDAYDAGNTDLEARADAVSALLGLMANRNRLLILCRLASEGEISVGRLTELVGLSQSALSQHLALLREAKIVDIRKQGQSVYYRIADQRALALMGALESVFCQSED